MANKFDEMRQAVREAEFTLDAADTVASQMASMLVGRMKKVNSAYTLAQLKRELRAFNIHTGKWRKR